MSVYQIISFATKMYATTKNWGRNMSVYQFISFLTKMYATTKNSYWLYPLRVTFSKICLQWNSNYPWPPLMQVTTFFYKLINVHVPLLEPKVYVQFLLTVLFFSPEGSFKARRGFPTIKKFKVNSLT